MDAWYRIDPSGYSIFYELPPDPTGLTKFQDGWEDELEELKSDLELGWGITLKEDGHFDKVFYGIPDPEPDPTGGGDAEPEEPTSDMDRFYSELVDAVREGINSV